MYEAELVKVSHFVGKCAWKGEAASAECSNLEEIRILAVDSRDKEAWEIMFEFRNKSLEINCMATR